MCENSSPRAQTKRGYRGILFFALFILGGFANSLSYVYPQLIIIFSNMGIIRTHLYHSYVINWLSKRGILPVGRNER